MKTDRELLELAAKAAGLSISWSKDCFGNETGPWINNSGWRPLHDDGDALRLAVNLCLWIGVQEDCTTVSDHYGRFRLPIEEPFESDHRAATRRAIVRAAAAIGEAMP